jgi:hypothetical protein
VGTRVGGRSGGLAALLRRWLPPLERLLPGGQGDEEDDEGEAGGSGRRRSSGPTFADVAGADAAKQVKGVVGRVGWWACG